MTKTADLENEIMAAAQDFGAKIISAIRKASEPEDDKGRTSQLNVKIKPELREELDALIVDEGLTLADWMERTIEAAIAARLAPHGEQG